MTWRIKWLYKRLINDLIAVDIIKARPRAERLQALCEASKTTLPENALVESWFPDLPFERAEYPKDLKSYLATL